MNPHADHSRSAAVRRVLDANLLRTDYRTQIDMLLTLAEQLEDELQARMITLEWQINRVKELEAQMDDVIEGGCHVEHVAVGRIQAALAHLADKFHTYDVQQVVKILKGEQ